MTDLRIFGYVPNGSFVERFKRLSWTDQEAVKEFAATAAVAKLQDFEGGKSVDAATPRELPEWIADQGKTGADYLAGTYEGKEFAWTPVVEAQITPEYIGALRTAGTGPERFEVAHTGSDVGGYLVRFDSPYSDGVSVTGAADFGPLRRGLPVYYGHGHELRTIGVQIGVADVTDEPDGLRIKARLQLRRIDAAAVEHRFGKGAAPVFLHGIGELVRRNLLGWSPGATTTAKGSGEQVLFSIGEASLTPTPKCRECRAETIT